jgi:hypothetical protein
MVIEQALKDPHSQIFKFNENIKKKAKDIP